MRLRKFNIALIICLSVILCGLCTYTVYAAYQSHINLSNHIIFEAEGVFYTAEVNVHYQGESNNITHDKIDKSGNVATHMERSDMVFSTTPFNFDRNHKVIVYDIIIHNYSQFDVKVTLEYEPGDEYIENSVDSSIGSEYSLQARDIQKGNDDIDGVTMHLITKAKSLKSSFSFNNDFTVKIEEVSSQN